MGNRAIIQVGDKLPAIYLHWNGGPESVYAFLDFTAARVPIGADQDPDRFEAYFPRLIQVLGNFFGGKTSFYVLNHPIAVDDLVADDWGAGWDGGIYWIDDNPNHDRKLGWEPGRIENSPYLVIGRRMSRSVGDKREPYLFTPIERHAERVAAYNHAYWHGPEGIIGRLSKDNDAHFFPDRPEPKRNAPTPETGISLSQLAPGQLHITPGM